MDRETHWNKTEGRAFARGIAAALAPLFGIAVPPVIERKGDGPRDWTFDVEFPPLWTAAGMMSLRYQCRRHTFWRFARFEDPPAAARSQPVMQGSWRTGTILNPHSGKWNTYIIPGAYAPDIEITLEAQALAKVARVDPEALAFALIRAEAESEHFGRGLRSCMAA